MFDSNRLSSLKRKARFLEEEFDVEITINENLVKVEGDSINEYIVHQVLFAISRGFTPAVALNAAKDNYAIKSIDLKDRSNSAKDLKRRLGRVIGGQGKSKKMIEVTTQTNICVYEHYISVIGEYDRIKTAIEAVFKIIEGSPHANVFKFLEDEEQKRLRRELIG